MEFEDINSNINYLITGTVEFYPASKKLYNRKEESEVSLLRTSSRCLSALLRHHKRIVTQNELLRYIWEDEYQEVSYNTFYQCLFNLRQALSEVGINKDFIRTIPRKGVVVDEPDVLLLQNTEQQITTEEDKEENGTVNYNPQVRHPFRDFIVSYRLLIMMMLLTLAAGVGVLKFGDDHENTFFYDYTFQPSFSGKCDVFFNSDVDNHKPHSTFMAAVHDSLCTSDHVLYITTYIGSRSVSAINCQKRDTETERRHCTSHYYPDYF